MPYISEQCLTDFILKGVAADKLVQNLKELRKECRDLWAEKLEKYLEVYETEITELETCK